MKTLDTLIAGESATVQSIDIEGGLRQRLLDMGIIPGSEVTFLKKAPMGDPIEIVTHGYCLTLRLDEAKCIKINEIDNKPTPAAPKQNKTDLGYNLSLHSDNAHPGIGEAGKYHSKTHAHPLPKDTVLTFALAGQLNSGKTTLFNQLTGSNQHVGNFPGVTVERKDKPMKDNEKTLVTDLPGIYSLSTYTADEAVSRDFLINEKPKAIINIVDASNIERNLYLTIQLMELEIPMVLALNMMDEVTANGGAIRVNEMERLLGIPVVPISASKGDGIVELVDHAMHIATYQEPPARNDFCSKDDFGGAVHRCLHSIMHLIEDHAEAAGIPKRFAASRIVEDDKEIINRLQLTQNEIDAIEDVISDMEKHRGLDRHAAMADMRFSFIEKLCNDTVIKPRESKELRRSRQIDKILTGKWTAIPSFLLIIGTIFWLTFDVVGLFLQNLLDDGITALASVVDAAFVQWQVSDAVRSLVVDAIFGGVGSVVSFVPIIIVLFFFLSLLEDSGYMARIAFVSDKLLRKIGLSGRSIVPLLISFGCSVPGVMAARTLPSARDRKATILLTPFMSCSTKIAIYGFFVNAFFPGRGGIIIVGLYLLGIMMGILVALMRKWIGKKYETSPFVMELPVYRMPLTKNVFHLLWDKTKDFLQMAFTVIFLATIIIWGLQSFDFRLNFISDPSDSILAAVSGWIAPLFAPLGLGDWRIVTALISGYLAKESVVATLDILGATSAITTLTAIPMLIFCLLYTPCVAAITAIRHELGEKWAAFVVVFQCVLAWLCAWIGYLIASIL